MVREVKERALGVKKKAGFGRGLICCQKDSRVIFSTN